MEQQERKYREGTLPRQWGKGFIAVLCVFALLLGQAALASSAQGTTLRLEGKEGVVFVKNAAGKNVGSSLGLRLQNGYTVSTSAGSYAYISLGNSKAVKLDAFTTCVVRTKGSQLELLVQKGRLFFNVTAPLAANETMQVRSSTMVTGIRGTSGIVTEDSVSLLTGHCTVQALGSDGAAAQQVEITAGETAQVDLGGGGTATLSTAGLEVAAMPAFARVEVAKDATLQAAIAETGTLDVTAVVEGADAALEAEQQEQVALAEATEAAKAEEKESNESTLTPEVTTPPASGGGSGGSGGDSGDGGGSTEPPAPVVPHLTVDFTGTSAVELQELLDRADVLTVRMVGVHTLELQDHFLVPDGKSLVIADDGANGTIVTFTSNITGEQYYEFQIIGTLSTEENTQIFMEDGVAPLLLGSRALELYGSMVLRTLDANNFGGNLYVGMNPHAGSGHIYGTGSLTANYLKTEVATSSFVNEGTLTVVDLQNLASFENRGTLEVQDVLQNGMNGSRTPAKFGNQRTTGKL